MLKKSVIALFIFVTALSQAQTDSTVAPAKTETLVETMPEFPGGGQALNSYLAKNINYPVAAMENEIQGKVIIEYTIQIDGQVVDTFILKGIGFGCDEEALRVVKAMPRWKPGTQNGKPVNITYKLPVKFTIYNEKPKRKSKKKE